MTPWAFTKLKEAEKCGRSFAARYVDRSYPFEKTPAMEEGIRVHSAMERHIRDSIDPPSDLLHLRAFVPSVLLDSDFLGAEVELGILGDFSPCSFFDSDCYFRGKLDVIHISDGLAIISDWKTGKPYEDPDELNLHAMLAKAHYPEVKHWRGCYIWVRERRMGTLHTLSPAVTYRKLVERIDKIDCEDRTPRKNNLCPWCPDTTCPNRVPK